MVYFVCLICEKAFFTSVAGAGQEEQIIKIVCSVCAEEMLGEETIRPRILNDSVD